MLRISAKYVAGTAIFLSWMNMLYWVGKQPLGWIPPDFLVVLTASSAVSVFGTISAISDREKRRTCALGAVSMALLSGLVFFSSKQYGSILDWFTGPAIFVFVLAVIAGIYALLSQIEKDIASFKSRDSNVVDIRRDVH